jgi:hypothetical protein
MGTLGKVSKVDVLVTAQGNIHLSVVSDFTIQSITLLVFVLQFNVKYQSKNGNQACESASYGAATNVKWPF